MKKVAQRGVHRGSSASFCVSLISMQSMTNLPSTIAVLNSSSARLTHVVTAGCGRRTLRARPSSPGGRHARAGRQQVARFLLRTLCRSLVFVGFACSATFGRVLRGNHSIGTDDRRSTLRCAIPKAHARGPTAAMANVVVGQCTFVVTCPLFSLRCFDHYADS
jgi:hypothetical protein